MFLVFSLVACEETRGGDSWGYGDDAATEDAAGEGTTDSSADSDTTGEDKLEACGPGYPEPRTEYPSEDQDGDSVPIPIDNCPRVANPEQEDSDGDAVGDACDPEPEDACEECGAAGESCQTADDCCDFPKDRSFDCIKGKCEYSCVSHTTTCGKDSHCCSGSCVPAGEGKECR